jgi:hypothetical protein
MHWLLQMAQKLASAVIVGNQRLVASSKLFACKQLCPTAKSALWRGGGGVAIAMAPFIITLATLEILYVWYWNDLWDSLSGFWAAFALAAVSTSLLTSLVMTAPHASVLLFLNRWVYAVVFLLAIAETVGKFLGMLYGVTRAELPRLIKQGTVQKGVGGVVQEVTHNRLAWVRQIAMSPIARLVLLHQ